MDDVIIYTDGACFGNPGPGGYGVVLRYKQHCKELSGGYRKTTNNRMELLAAIVSLKALKSAKQLNVFLYSDSKYLVDAVNKGWLSSWTRTNWKKGKVKNIDLWLRLLPELEKHKIKFIWVEGHSGVPDNERCDVLSKEAASGKRLHIDSEYEKTLE